jgi:GAF domain-containing protein
MSFWGHAILQTDMLVVEDTAQDARFADNPLVTGEPNIRFYAGRPLLTYDGSAVGTLCIIDRQPRRFTQTERAAL